MILRSQNQQFFFKDQRGLPNLIYRTPLNKIVMKDNEQFENNFNKDKELQKLECSINEYLHNIFDIQDNTLIKQHIIQSQIIRKSFFC